MHYDTRKVPCVYSTVYALSQRAASTEIPNLVLCNPTRSASTTNVPVFLVLVGE